MKLRKTKSFTLIELLVVVFIVGSLAGLVTVNFSRSRMKARDARRISDLTTVASALQAHYADYHRYPTQPNPSCNEGIGATDPTATAWCYTYMVSNSASTLVSGNYITSSPQDPNPDYYRTYRYAFWVGDWGGVYIDATSYRLWGGMETNREYSWQEAGRYIYGIKNGEKCRDQTACWLP